jgi:hypothetical protein
VAASTGGSTRLEVVIDPVADTLRVLTGNGDLPKALQPWFDAEGRLANGSPEAALVALEQLRTAALPELRLSQEIAPWLENRRRAAERKELRREYERKVQSGEWPAHETTVPLFPYQREGMLHLAFTERALLADEMGLGKTIQAIAACALLQRLGQAQRALVVTPASLKTEWEEQIGRFTPLPYQLVFGGHPQRLRAYADPPFFTIVNYEQMVIDALDVNARLRPDIVVLDEAQRIKNWNTKTAQAIKRLRSRYAFILTGTPVENRIDELHSLMDFLNPSVLGPLFRFNRDFYALDDRGRPVGYRNLDQLQARIRPHLLRRRKADVETELPERTDRNHFVKLSEPQKQNYAAHEQQVSRLVNAALVRCEERYPQSGAHSVLVVVVERDAAPLRERLEGLHRELFGPGQTDPLAPTQLEVIDRATDEALERLIAAGLVSRTTRATRPLSPEAEAGSPPPLSAEEQARAKAHREHAARKLKMARLLAEGGLEEEARAALLAAILPLARALAVERRLPEPDSVDEALLPPLSHGWREGATLVRDFVADSTRPCKPVLEGLPKV